MCCADRKIPMIFFNRIFTKLVARKLQDLCSNKCSSVYRTLLELPDLSANAFGWIQVRKSPNTAGLT
jgi:hypothetical protein